MTAYTETYFASPGRQPRETVDAQRERLRSIPHLVELLEAFPTLAVVLNTDRQIVMHNTRFTETLPTGDYDRLLGLRLGETIGCVHAADAPSGCGTGEHCRMCGAVLSMLEAQNGSRSVQECRITVGENGGDYALDFRVLAVPLQLGEDEITILSLIDISDEKRRRVLERIFFHDILNTASGLKSVSELFRFVAEHDREELIEDLEGISDQLIGEIETQRDLLAAENDELSINPHPVLTDDMLEHIIALYRYHHLARGYHLKSINRAPGYAVITDATLLSRVLGNLVKNALEASTEGGTVSLTCTSREEGWVTFAVHNAGVMPEPVRLQVFQRSFSTKGSGRGIGTYSVKLLVERFLRGHVHFTSEEEEGTAFFVDLPLRHPEYEPAADPIT